MAMQISTNQVAGRMPPLNKWYQDFGLLSGAGTRQLTDALLAYLTKGSYQPGQVPTSGTYTKPGTPLPQQWQLNSSGGIGGAPGMSQQPRYQPPQQFPINPQGRVDSGQYAGNTLEELIGQGVVPKSAMNWQQPTKTSFFQPGLDRQVQQLQIQKLQEAMNPQSPNNILKRTLIEDYLRQQQTQGSGNTSGQTGQSSQTLSPQLRRQLGLLAFDGDEEAIALLQQAGEL